LQYLIVVNLQSSKYTQLHQLLLLYKVLTTIRFLLSPTRFSKIVQTGVANLPVVVSRIGTTIMVLLQLVGLPRSCTSYLCATQSCCFYNPQCSWASHTKGTIRHVHYVNICRVVKLCLMWISGRTFGTHERCACTIKGI